MYRTLPGCLSFFTWLCCRSLPCCILLFSCACLLYASRARFCRLFFDVIMIVLGCFVPVACWTLELLPGVWLCWLCAVALCCCLVVVLVCQPYLFVLLHASVDFGWLGLSSLSVWSFYCPRRLYFLSWVSYLFRTPALIFPMFFLSPSWMAVLLHSFPCPHFYIDQLIIPNVWISISAAAIEFCLQYIVPAECAIERHSCFTWVTGEHPTVGLSKEQ